MSNGFRLNFNYEFSRSQSNRKRDPARVCPTDFWLAGAVRFLIPNVLYEPSLRFKAGRPEDYPDGSVTFLEEERVFLIRKGNTYRCLSATCTHLGCTVDRADSGYHCPCHGSVFDDMGVVKGGPAPRALEWFLVTLSKDSRLLVDKSQTVASDKYLVT